jgi:hypothetical protein
VGARMEEDASLGRGGNPGYAVAPSIEAARVLALVWSRALQQPWRDKYTYGDCV